MAAAWEASGGFFFTALQCAGVNGINGTTAAGLGAALGTAAAALTAFFHRTKKPAADEVIETASAQPEAEPAAPVKRVQFDEESFVKKDRVEDAATIPSPPVNFAKDVRSIDEEIVNVVEAQVESRDESTEAIKPTPFRDQIQVAQQVEDAGPLLEEDEDEEEEEEEEEPPVALPLVKPSKPGNQREVVLTRKDEDEESEEEEESESSEDNEPVVSTSTNQPTSVTEEASGREEEFSWPDSDEPDVSNIKMIR